jgi:hypothetical protein
MRSIPALYNNQTFASRTEARHAYFWDILGISWSYEPEVLSLDGEPAITYIPDFWLPSFQARVEIKGEITDDPTGLLILEKCRRVAMQSDRPIVLCFSDPLDMKCAVFRQDRMYTDALWTTCMHCGSVAIKIRKADGAVVWCPKMKEHGADALSVSDHRQYARAFYEAALSARQARFGWPKTKKAS